MLGIGLMQRGGYLQNVQICFECLNIINNYVDQLCLTNKFSYFAIDKDIDEASRSQLWIYNYTKNEDNEKTNDKGKRDNGHALEERPNVRPRDGCPLS